MIDLVPEYKANYQTKLILRIEVLEERFNAFDLKNEIYKSYFVAYGKSLEEKFAAFFKMNVVQIIVFWNIIYINIQLFDSWWQF